MGWCLYRDTEAYWPLRGLRLNPHSCKLLTIKITSALSFAFFFLLSQLRCGRGPRPERQASYLHSTSHIRLTSIKKNTPTAALAPAANGNPNRQEVALWRRTLRVWYFQLHLLPSVKRCTIVGEVFCCRAAMDWWVEGWTTNMSLIQVEWLQRLLHSHQTYRLHPYLGNQTESAS